MKFTKLVPSVFYHDIQEGIRLFVDCLGFEIEHEELKAHQPFCVVVRDGLRLNIFQDSELAAEHHPELRLVTPNIEAAYQQISASHPEYLHPNLPRVTRRPWGALEFALRDSQLGVRIQEWPE
ncbi:MAG: hypothetical protein U0176_02875 [Bacteroidia bacterium]